MRHQKKRAKVISEDSGSLQNVTETVLLEAEVSGA